ncbi:MAG: 4-(cytidine 5'-diphospho)-2-C-methyl-D-erythritol kinase, partial [Oscillospiraceae bacterium]
VRIVLRKRLPYQAGLGSASADAAATLLGLNLLFGEPLAADALAALGLRIGADVPFGLQGGTMLAQGIGEQLTPLPPLTGGVFVIAKPAEGMSTPEAYARYDALKSPMQPDSARLCAALAAGEPKRIAAGFGNVLEQIGPPAGVARLKSALLREGALGAAMTGSGTAVFGLFCDEASARAACATLVPQTVFCETARPLSRGVYRLTGEASAF